MNFNKIKEILSIDQVDKNEFNQEITSFNRCAFYAMCVLTFIVECVTLSRIFIVSSVKLGSMNNRIYFAFYMALIVVSILILSIQVLTRNKENQNYTQVLRMQYIFVCVYCIWSTAFNMHELLRNINIWQYINSIIIASVFLYLKPIYIVSLLVPNHIIFTVYLINMSKNGSDMTGAIINGSAIVVIGLFISISRYVGKLQDFKRRKKLLHSNNMLEQLNQKLNYLTITDALSKLGNRRYFDDKLKQYWDMCIYKECTLTVIMIDIDNFKNFNDVYGHQAGDECIVRVASALKNATDKEEDVAFRYGGEEFVAILIDYTHQESQTIANHICSSVEALKIPNKIGNKEQYVTISLGVCCEKPNKCEKPTDFVEKADKALYMAKENGKNQVRVF